MRLTENLPQLAAEAFGLSHHLCGSCQNYHSLWTYQRIAGASGGDVATPLIDAVLGQLLSKPSRTILIAGSADTGLLAVVARVARPDSRIVVVDRCETPLELCRRFASRTVLQVETVRTNLADLKVGSSFDVVFAHSLLQYIAADQRLEALLCMRRSLLPDGQLVLVFRTSARIEGKLLPEYREAYSKQFIEQLEALNVPLPEPREAFRRRVQIYAEERRSREGIHANHEEVEKLIESAGFSIQDVTSIEADQSDPFRTLAAKISKRRFLLTARPNVRSRTSQPN